MNDTVQGGAPADDGVTAGMLLRRAREAAGMHVATLAVSLKVPVRKLEALEEDRYDQLSDAVFVRALASSVCRTLKIDPQPVLDRLPQSGKPRLMQADEGINTPFRAPGDAPRPSWLQLLTRPVSLIVLALLIGAGVILLLPASRRDEAPQSVTRTDPVMPPGTPAAVVTPPADTAALPASAAGTVTTTIAPPVLAPAAPVAAAAAARPAASQTVAAAPAASAASAPTQPASAADGIVVFRAKGPSWVQVVDAKGTMVFRKLMEPGETAGASGALPLAVTVGSVKETEVQVRGKPFDLGSVSRDNVARFEVK